jgi:hypothetical protein
MFDGKFSCAWTRRESIATDASGQLVNKGTSNELPEATFVAVSVNDSVRV